MYLNILEVQTNMSRKSLTFSVETNLTFLELLKVLVSPEFPRGLELPKKMELIYDLSHLSDRDGVKLVDLDFEKTSKVVTATVHFTTEDHRNAVEKEILEKL